MFRKASTKDDFTVENILAGRPVCEVRGCRTVASVSITLRFESRGHAQVCTSTTPRCEACKGETVEFVRQLCDNQEGLTFTLNPIRN